MECQVKHAGGLMLIRMLADGRLGRCKKMHCDLMVQNIYPSEGATGD